MMVCGILSCRAGVTYRRSNDWGVGFGQRFFFFALAGPRLPPVCVRVQQGPRLLLRVGPRKDNETIAEVRCAEQGRVTRTGVVSSPLRERWMAFVCPPCLCALPPSVKVSRDVCGSESKRNFTYPPSCAVRVKANAYLLAPPDQYR